MMLVVFVIVRTIDLLQLDCVMRIFGVHMRLCAAKRPHTNHGRQVMQQMDLDTWDEFKREVAKLRTERDAKMADGSIPFLSLPAFRGQASDQWALTTTLERAGHENMAFTHYAIYVNRIYPEIRAVTGHHFEVPTVPDFNQWHDELVRTSSAPHQAPLGYEFMVYLRQHGYPSPLLDWTDSEYIAAYFAFIDAGTRDHVDRVAIYAFTEYADGTKISSFSAPMIMGLGQFAMTHPRHFTQQARYTIGMRLDGHQWRYAPHNLVFQADQGSLTNRQDVLLKFTLPISERKNVMNELLRANLTPWSLFGTEESLMRTMALKTLQEP